MKQSVRYYIVVISALLLQACATSPSLHTTHMLHASDLPDTRPGLDHYIAWVPLEQAQTATVAEAMTHISLKHAREQLRHEVCEGNSVTAGIVVEKHGPVAARTPASLGAYPAWYYRISMKPGLDGCGTRPSVGLYRALQARLPDWLSLSPGKPLVQHTAGLQPGF